MDAIFQSNTERAWVPIQPPGKVSWPSVGILADQHRLIHCRTTEPVLGQVMGQLWCCLGAFSELITLFATINL